MRVTTMDRYEPAPGRIVEFVPSAATLAAADGAPVSPVPPSFNQRFHLATERPPGAPGHWLACAFDLPGPLDAEALRAAFEAWGKRHGTLRSGFRAGPSGTSGASGPSGGPERFMVASADYALVARDAGSCPSTDATRAWLTRRLGEACRPLGWPSYVFAAIERNSERPGERQNEGQDSETFTVLCGFDHSNADAYSLAIAVHELRELYAGTAASLPPVGSFVDHCAREGTSGGEVDVELLRGWAEFFAACGGTTPSFPLPLGLPAGQRAAQGTASRRLLGPDGADAFERACRTAGGSAFTGVLTAVALAARGLGSDSTLRLCTPLHTRYEERWTHAIGWFTTIAPLTVDVSDVPGVIEGIRATRTAFRRARELATLPVARVLPALPALGAAFRRDRDDVFMVSYVDYRRLPGAEHHTGSNAHHISGVTATDDAQFWFSRTHEGLFLRSRYPATPTAERTLRAFTAAVAVHLATPAWPEGRAARRGELREASRQ
ncbi:condensation domain-containing protein [Streptomyces sp. NBC_01429]|uniref:condensation domain-containing protein n=1 Tax=Streptomyces sp. NBC_01429 TaxID=2903862 RepID=UPI002E2CD9FA|nr:condensation domain-containing protein [Streptomyces sp. NBC_01429]